MLDTADILQGSTIAAGQQIDDSFSGFVTDGGPGANSVSLRGLGAQRTLVLVNGKRWGPSGVRGSTNSVDLSALPSSIISRVEILKDGASSIYGADAVAGVINVITKERQDGWQFNLASSTPLEGGAENYAIDGVWGVIGGDWSFNVAVDYSQQKKLVRNERDYSECNTRPRLTDRDGDGGIDNRDPVTGKLLCFGAIYGLLTSPFGFIRYDPSLAPGAGIDNPNYDVDINGDLGIPYFTRVDAGPLDNQGAFYRDNVTEYRAAQIVSESDLLSLTSFGDKDFTLFDRTATVYYEFYYNRRETEANGGYQQLFPRIPATNPTNPFGGLNASVQPVIMSWNILDPVYRVDVERINTFVGLKGDLTEAWNYELYLGYGQSTGTYRTQSLLEDRLGASLDAVHDADGNLVCRDVANFPGCVAANWFTAEALLEGSLPADHLAYVRKNIKGKTDYDSFQFSAIATGPLFTLWWEDGGEVQGVFGLEIRRESINDRPDPDARRDNIFSTTAADITKGDDTVKEAFVEIEFPLVTQARFAEELTLNLAVRYTDYESYGYDTTERVQVNWQIIPLIRARATYGTSFRAPDLFEQFLGNQTGFQSGLLDPCVNYGDDFDPGDVVYENCASLGLPVDHGTSGVPGIRAVTGGNPDLLAETSDSLTVGTILTPEGLDLSIAVNYFEIELKNTVAGLSVGFVIGDCYTSVDLTSPFCSRIASRDTAGFLTDIDASLLNIGVERTKGFDLDIVYSHAFPRFDLTMDLTATYIKEQFFELLGDEFSLAGNWGFPRWSSDLDVYIDWKDWRFLWGVEFIGASAETPQFDPDTTNRNRINRTPSTFYHNWSARYTSPNDWQVIATLRNVFDKEPPIVSDGQDSDSASRVFNTLPGVGYSLLGRTLVLQFSKGF